MYKFRNWNRIVMDENPGGEGQGGGGGNDPAKAFNDLKAQNDLLLKRLEALENKNKGEGSAGDDDLATKAAKDRIEKEKNNNSQKRLESALKFTLGANEWLKTNASLLPKTVEGIFVQAEKENYGNAIEKDSAIKAGVLSEFFAIQANLDLLTESQKIALADFKALTKNDKQERAQAIYEQIFEPTFEMLKRIKKAELVNKGFANPSDLETSYKNKLIGISRKKYLGEK